jgi:HK97 family phage portal protein
MGILSKFFPKLNKRSSPSVKVNYVQQRSKYTTINSQEKALENSVVYRATSILTDSVASIPLGIYRKNAKGYWELDTTNPLYNLLTRKSNSRLTIYELLEGLVMQLIMQGNAYIFIKRDAMSDIKELILLYPGTVYHDVINNSYRVTDAYNKINGIYNSSQIIRISHKSLETVTGKPVTDYLGKTLALAYACDSESLTTLNNGGRLKGIITSDSSLTGFSSAIDSQVETIRDNLEEEINSGKDILTLQSGSNFIPISQTGKDLQVTENKQFSLSDLARYFGVSLSKLQITFAGNYAASMQEQISFYQDTLNPILTKIEKAFNSYLIPDSVSTKYKIEFDRSTLSYYKEILGNYEKQMQLGISSVNDIRNIFNRAPVENGDKTVISTNLQYIENPKVEAPEIGKNSNTNTDDGN